MIKDRYCSYEVARLFKEKGFDEECTCLYYNGDLEFANDNVYEHTVRNSSIANKDFITAPTHQMACDYVLATYGFWVAPTLLTVFDKDEDGFKTEKVVWTFDVISASTGKFFYEDYEDGERKEYASQYEATEAGLKYFFENLM